MFDPIKVSCKSEQRSNENGSKEIEFHAEYVYQLDTEESKVHAT